MLLADARFVVDPVSFNNLSTARATTQVISAGSGGVCTGHDAFREQGLPAPDWPIVAPCDRKSRGVAT